VGEAGEGGALLGQQHRLPASGGEAQHQSSAKGSRGEKPPFREYSMGQ
jgi:hypothetical protein